MINLISKNALQQYLDSKYEETNLDFSREVDQKVKRVFHQESQNFLSQYVGRGSSIPRGTVSSIIQLRQNSNGDDENKNDNDSDRPLNPRQAIKVQR